MTVENVLSQILGYRTTSNLSSAFLLTVSSTYSSMKPKLVLIFLGLVAASQCKRPPWYKPCWIYLCGMDFTDPVCAWDPHHGARLFRNDCEMDRHNFCYNRNYAIVESDHDVEQDMKLCAKLNDMVERADKKPSVVQDGNVKVHFLLDKHSSEKQDRSLERKHKRHPRKRYDYQSRHHHRGENDLFSDISLVKESSYES